MNPSLAPSLPSPRGATLPAWAVAGLVVAAAAGSALAGFSWSEPDPDGHTDLLHDGRAVVRYQHAPLDTSSKEARELTYKPFHHVFARDGETLLTKGPGGQFTHHRGIFYGFSKTRWTDADGNTHGVDTWHCPKGWQQHVETLDQEAGDTSASHTVAIDWFGEDGTKILTEHRTLGVRLEGEDLVIDFGSVLETDLPGVTLDGDPQHAGFQFRASNEVSESTKGETIYLRPSDGRGSPGETRNWPQDKSQVDLPWKAMSFVVGGKRHSTLYLDHPDNPKPAMFSERDYGRFGSYFVAEVKPDEPLRVRYRLVIREGEFTPEEAVARSEAFTGAGR